MNRLIVSIFAIAALLFAGVAPAQVYTDAGKTGIARPAHLQCASAVAATVTGTAAETTLATCTIPPGAVGPNGGLLVNTTWTLTNSANTKTPRVRLGGAAGAAYLGANLTATVAYADVRRIRNRGSLSSQVGGFAANSSTGLGSSTASVVTSSVDFSASVPLVMTCQLGLSTESCTLESYEVWVLP